MVGYEITPTELGKHSKIIKAAQEEMASLDVIVCGRCLTVFHFIEDFKKHKQKPCSKDECNNIRECNDTKPKIWAFLLWKAAKLNKSNNLTTNSWALYQSWMKMDENLRETWIVAGKTIQSLYKVSKSNLQKMPVKITKTVVNNHNSDGSGTPIKSMVAKTITKSSNAIKSGELEREVMSIKGSSTNNSVQKVVKKPTDVSQMQGKLSTSSQAKAILTTSTKFLTRHAKRTMSNSDEVVDQNVDKIIAKRFNPRRNMHEYLVKWDMQTLENTWEPASHLQSVPHLLDTFEMQLARQKETRAAMQAKNLNNQIISKSMETNKTAVDAIKKEILPVAGSAKPMIKSKVENINTSDGMKSQLDSERQWRTSKSKAMDQVKQWVSATSHTSSGVANSKYPVFTNAHDGEKEWPNTSHVSISGIKRKQGDMLTSKNHDTPSSTTSTLEDLEEDLIPSHTLKKMKYGNAVSVEVKTRQDALKNVKVNGTTTRKGRGIKSSKIIVLNDWTTSGIAKKSDFISPPVVEMKSESNVRIVSKEEAKLTGSGILCLRNSTTDRDTSKISNEINIGTSTVATVTSTQSESKASCITLRAQGEGTLTNVPINKTPAVQSVGNQPLIRTPSGTTIQRKTIPANSSTNALRLPSAQIRTTAQESTTASRVIISRQGTTCTTNTKQQKTVTPEQKILQLSKSGDLKVTKKVITREDVLAQRANQQQNLRQQQARQQSQIHIQKVQQLAGPVHKSSITSTTTTTTTRKQQLQRTSPAQVEDEHQAQLCPITGNIITSGDNSQQNLQSGIIQNQILSDQQQQTEQHQQQQQEQQQIQQPLVLQQQAQEQLHDIDTTLLLSQDDILANEDGTPLLVTGEDGTVYQVAGKNAEGQTILVTQGPDGEQQFAYVATTDVENDNQVLALNHAVASAVVQLPVEEVEALAAAAGVGSSEPQYLVKTTQEDGTTQVITMTEAELAQHQAMAAQQQQQGAQAANNNTGNASQLSIQTEDDIDGNETNIPAEVVQADPASPGGTRRVLLLLQDGTFVMTEMHDDEFKALNISA